MRLNFTLAYFKHLLIANNRHGTHSPFVYRLADEVIYDFSLKNEYETIEAQRKKLLDDVDLITKSALNDNSPSFKNSLNSPRLAQLIFRLAVNHAPVNIIEMGTGFGLTTAYLAKACPQANVITIENSAEKAIIANKNFEELKLNNIQIRVGDFSTLFSELINAKAYLSFVYFNRTYSKAAILNYFNLCLPKLNEHSLLIFEGLYKSEQMKEAWSEIKNHPKVTITIDLFWLGLVYFKKDQAKEHFKLKF